MKYIELIFKNFIDVLIRDKFVTIQTNHRMNKILAKETYHYGNLDRAKSEMAKIDTEIKECYYDTYRLV